MNRALLLSLATLAASCATKEGESTTERPDGGTLPADAGEDGAVDECAEAGAEGGPRCTTEALSCEEADFCVVPAPLDGRTLLSVWGDSKTDVWAAGTNGTIVHYDGTKWESVPSPTQQPLFGIWGSGASDVWIASSRSAVFRGAGFAGKTTAWTRIPEVTPARPTWSPKEGMLLGIWGSAKDDVWIGGEPYAVDEIGQASQWRSRASDEGGIAFTAARISDGSAAATPPIRGIWGSSASDVWAVGGGDGLNFSSVSTRGKTYHATETDEAGAPRWSEVDSQSTPILFAVAGSAPNDVWAVGNEGTIRHFGGGKRWDIVASPTREGLRGVWAAAANDVWAVGEHGTILHYDGASFQTATIALPLGNKPDLSAVWGSSPNDVWVVGKGITLHFTGPKTSASTEKP